MKFLITGGAGFIGSNYLHYVVKKYNEDYFITLDSLTYAGNYNNIKLLEKRKNFKFIKGDITDTKHVNEIFKKENIDIVINFAAESHVDNSIENPSIFLKTNILGTQILMDACIRYGVERFHQISTDEVYGDLPIDRVDLRFTEDSILNPSSPYSVSKASADLLVNAYNRTYGLKTTISRCSNNYGRYQHVEKLIPKVISKALKNEKIPIYGTGENVRDWIHVLDHNIAVDKIVRKGVAGKIYNIGANCEISNIDLVKIILKLLNKSTNLITFVENRKGHDLRYAIDSAKIIKEFNFKPSINFEEGIKDTIIWYKQYN